MKQDKRIMLAVFDKFLKNPGLFSVDGHRQIFEDIKNHFPNLTDDINLLTALAGEIFVPDEICLNYLFALRPETVGTNETS